MTFKPTKVDPLFITNDAHPTLNTVTQVTAVDNNARAVTQRGRWDSSWTRWVISTRFWSPLYVFESADYRRVPPGCFDIFAISVAGRRELPQEGTSQWPIQDSFWYQIEL